MADGIFFLYKKLNITRTLRRF